MKPDYSICIPTWNNVEMLLSCISNIIEHVEANYVIHVLNNGKTVEEDGMTFKEFMRRHTPEHLVHVHDMGENKGWSGALNYAYANGLMDTKYVLILNDDTVVIPNNARFLHDFAKWMETDPKIGAVGPTTNVVMGNQKFTLKNLPPFHITTLLIGFCCMIQKSALDAIAVDGVVWDESLPGGDDLDLSIRLIKAKYSLLVNRSIYIHHHGMQTGNRVHPGWWNSDDQRLRTDNALIRKHGIENWYDCLSSLVIIYVGPAGSKLDKDTEGDWLREYAIGDNGLDVGCGGNKSVEASIGVDRREPGSMGTTGGSRGVTAVNDIVADICDIPLPDESQDYIVGRHVLEHMADPVVALTEWKRLLKPNGMLLLACPDETVVKSITMDAEHVHVYTADSLSNLLVLIGLKVEVVHLFRPGFSFAIKAVKGAA